MSAASMGPQSAPGCDVHLPVAPDLAADERFRPAAWRELRLAAEIPSAPSAMFFSCARVCDCTAVDRNNRHRAELPRFFERADECRVCCRRHSLAGRIRLASRPHRQLDNAVRRLRRTAAIRYRSDLPDPTGPPNRERPQLRRLGRGGRIRRPFEHHCLGGIKPEPGYHSTVVSSI
jgi:hypothetical protein